MPAESTDKQRLQGSNYSPNIAETQSARVKDGLWFLARQFQTGEFEAENGGALAGIEIKSRHFPVKSLALGGKSVAIDRHAPLEALVEAETDSGESPSWRSEALEYEFELSTTGHKLKAVDYGGAQLDWYNFDLQSISGQQEPEDEVTDQLIPAQLYFRGAPHPRWWRMEDGAAFFDSPDDPEPNVLSMLLPEFFYTDINNWYLAPAPMLSGTVREIEHVKVTDSFGVQTA